MINLSDILKIPYWMQTMNRERIEQTAETLAPALFFISELIKEKQNTGDVNGLRTIAVAMQTGLTTMGVIFGKGSHETLHFTDKAMFGLLTNGTENEFDFMNDQIIYQTQQIANQQQAAEKATL